MLYCFVYYIKIALLPHKNEAINSNAFLDNRHIIRQSTNNFISGGNFNKTYKALYFILSNSLKIHEENSKEMNI